MKEVKGKTVYVYREDLKYESERDKQFDEIELYDLKDLDVINQSSVIIFEEIENGIDPKYKILKNKY